MIIHHEGDADTLPESILKKHGFRKWPKNKHGHIYGLRINPSHCPLYDRSGFLTWKRKVFPKGRLTAVILIPESIRTENDLKRVVGKIKLKIA